MKKIYLIFFILTSLTATAGDSERGAANLLLKQYLQRRETVANNQLTHQIELQDKTQVCGLCHGVDGNSTRENIPSLAGQNPPYLLEQLLVFKNKGRYPNMMHEMAQGLDDRSMVRIALYYAALPRKLNLPLDKKYQALGKELYMQLCTHCHGENAMGANHNYANIRRQRPDYLITSMKRFRDGDVKRSNHVMGNAVKGMSDDEIAALANYIAGL